MGSRSMSYCDLELILDAGSSFYGLRASGAAVVDISPASVSMKGGAMTSVATGEWIRLTRLPRPHKDILPVETVR